MSDITKADVGHRHTASDVRGGKWPLTMMPDEIVDNTQVASETAAGIVELATTAETVTGTDTTRATTPAGVKAAIDGQASTVSSVTPTISAGFDNFGSPFANAIAYKDHDGFVHVSAVLLRTGATTTASSVPFLVLPTGYRPTGYVAAVGSLSNDFLMTYVSTDGTIYAPASTTYTSSSTFVIISLSFKSA